MINYGRAKTLAVRNLATHNIFGGENIDRLYGYY